MVVSVGLELERKGRLHNHRERQRLTQELEEERLARSEDQREARREVQRLQREIRELVEELEEQRRAAKGSKGVWGTLFGIKSR